MTPSANVSQLAPRGTLGARSNRIDVSWSMRSRLRTLHGRHAATTFSHAWSPPRLRGTTWSMLSAGPPQYWQRWSSRANTERRLSGVFQRYGTRTYRRSRTTDGTATMIRGECMMASLACSISAVSPRTSTTALRSLTTHRGSNVALSTSALVIAAYPRTLVRRVGHPARDSLADAPSGGGQTTGGAGPSVATSASTAPRGTSGGRSRGRPGRDPGPRVPRRPSGGGSGGTRATAAAGTGGGATTRARPAPAPGAARCPRGRGGGRRRPPLATPSAAAPGPSGPRPDGAA